MSEFLYGLMAVSILIEALWQILKQAIQPLNPPPYIDSLGTLILGIGICVLAGIDLFSNVGITLAVPYVGQILTGIITSRGSNFTHDLISALYELRKGPSDS